MAMLVMSDRGVEAQEGGGAVQLVRAQMVSATRGTEELVPARAATDTTSQRSISRLAERYDVSLRTLRFYEEQGLLRPIRIGYGRFYSEKDEIRLQLILKGKRLGFTLHEIGRMIGYVDRPKDDSEDRKERLDLLELMDRETLERQTQHLEERRAEVDRAIEELRSALSQGQEPS